ncbi:MAG: ATP-binding protein, partial [Candidatus Firestonebacteria bacterium]
KAAYREAVINAFCHRDYYNTDAVHVAIFRDRLEIRSPGLLYGGLTIAKIRKCKCSERRNELLADMFHRVHFVERWGRGIKLILSKEPTADFEEIGRQFFTILKRKNLQGQKELKNVPVNVPEKNQDKRLQIVLDKIGQNNRITIAALSQSLAVNEKTIKRDIEKLKKKDLLQRIGPDKSGHWKVEKNDDI